MEDIKLTFMFWMQNNQHNHAASVGTYHFGCRVEHLHLLQDGGAVVGNGHVTFLILDLKQTAAPALVTGGRKRRKVELACDQDYKSVTHHLVHAFGPQAGSDSICNSCQTSRCNISTVTKINSTSMFS